MERHRGQPDLWSHRWSTLRGYLSAIWLRRETPDLASPFPALFFSLFCPIFFFRDVFIPRPTFPMKAKWFPFFLTLYYPLQYFLISFGRSYSRHISFVLISTHDLCLYLSSNVRSWFKICIFTLWYFMDGLMICIPLYSLTIALHFSLSLFFFSPQ